MRRERRGVGNSHLGRWVQIKARDEADAASWGLTLFICGRHRLSQNVGNLLQHVGRILLGCHAGGNLWLCSVCEAQRLSWERGGGHAAQISKRSGLYMCVFNRAGQNIRNVCLIHDLSWLHPAGCGTGI